MGKSRASFLDECRLYLFEPQILIILKNLFVASLLIFSFIACNVSSADKPAADDSLQYYPPTPGHIDKKEFRRYFRELTAFFNTTLLNTGFNGGILVAKDGAVIYEKYAGKIDLRKNEEITDSTSLHIASTGKTFTAMAVLRLVQENKLSLTDTLDKFFPGFPYPGITVEMLLNHRSGLPNYVYFIYNSGWNTKQFATNEDMLKVLYTFKPQRSYPPGKRFSYSNTNYALLAMIIEKVTGLTYPDYMREKIFEPLQMNHTYVFTLKDTLNANPSFTTSGNYWDYDFLDGTYGAKNIYSTPRDLLKWDQALYTDQLIRKSLLDSAFTPYSFEKPSINNYGLGWRLQLMPNGKKIIYHFGKWHGFNAAFARLTDEKATIIILGNRFNRNIYRAANLCYDIFGDYMRNGEKEPGEDNDDESQVKSKKQNNSSKPALAKSK